MPILTLLVFGLEEYEQPHYLACVKLPAGNYDASTRLSDSQLVALIHQLEAEPQCIAGVYTQFRLQYLLDGVPVGDEQWVESLLPGGWRNIALSDKGRYLRLENDYFDDRLPVLSL